MTAKELLRNYNDLPDAKNLLFGLKNWNLTDFIVHESEPLNEAFFALFEDGVRRLRLHEPIQYVLGEAWFYGRRFTVNPSVLIPRLDTEIIVREALKEARGRVLDLCTGSGCIGLTLKLEKPALHMTLSDVSEEALRVARENAAKFGVSVAILKSDLFSALQGTFDYIISNPPYIRDSEISELDPEVRDFEPRMALSGKEDGLYFYERIGAEAGRFLRPGGVLFLEIGDDQGETVPEILRKNGFSEISVIPDLAGRSRVVRAKKNEGMLG